MYRDFGFCVTKSSVQSWADPFYNFPEYDWRTRRNCQIVDRCTGSCLACRQTHTDELVRN